jgi:small conductance mechanosensitive channel
VLGLVSAFHLLGLTGVATSLLATGGLMAIVLGFAFREIGENLLAGVFLAFSRSFDVGDLIESSGLLGTVRAIDLRQVHIRTGDGCDIFIPSASIYRNPLHNYTRDGLRRTDFTIGIDYGDDPERARGLILEALRATPGVLADPEPAVLLSGFSATTVDLQAFLWVNAFGPGPGLGEVRHAAMVAARQALAEAGFTFSGNVRTGVDLYRADGLS